MPGTVSDAPTVSLSFANNFWGKEDAGVHPLLDRMHNAKVTCDELKSFYHARAALEDEYAHKLLALCRKPLGSSEYGTLRASLDVVRGEVESIGKAHASIAQQMKSELEEPLAAFAGGMKERRKIVQGGIEKLLKTKVQQTQNVNKLRDRYEQDCLRIKGYLAQGHMVMGQEERKNKAKLEKTQIQLASNSNEYEAAVKVLEETTGRWNKEWKAACDKFQDLEEERLDFTKSSLWSFANIASTVCVSDDASCEKVRLSLENCEVERDITGFIRERGTGQEIPDPPKYINFARGDVNDTSSEASAEDDSYSVAQFQRPLNPALRTSSPQPSTYESHHDPHSELAVRMGHGEATPPSREATLTPNKGVSQVPPLDLRRGGQVPPEYDASQHGELAPVPHNSYPTDGMTMFCRAGPPSERSGLTSGTRPSSRDSASEYSQPTSFSSQEPPSGKTSPTKPVNGVSLPGMSSDKAVQKKRSGFFTNSPFRRKSKHEREYSASMNPNTPGSRNTWAPSSRNNVSSTQSSPTKYGRQPLFGNDRQSASPEPVDPRANFQLNVGNNVFDVASPDQNTPKASRNAPAAAAQDELDPIARALADLKGVGKQSSVRVSADRYHGIATPAPQGTPGMPAPLSASANSALNAAQRGTPPPAYGDGSGSPVKRLDAPQPAFTSASMQAATRKYVGQANDVFGSSGGTNRPGTRDGMRAASPAPGMRATSPRPSMGGQYRSMSPNPHTSGGRPRDSQSTSPQKRGSDQNQAYQQQYSRNNSPNDIRRAASPGPGFQQQRPGSSMGGGGMEMQLSSNQVYHYGEGGGRGRVQSGDAGRPQSRYYAGGGAPSQHPGSRARSKSMAAPGATGPDARAGGQQFTREGRVIIHFARAMYSYTAAIPEELSFAKGDTLAVLRLQDDGWWEAENTTKRTRPGLVPSNYLQQV